MVNIGNLYPVNYIGRLRIGTDGKGIRTLIIFNDCPLKCRYCINSFTWKNVKKSKRMSVQELYDKIIIDRLYMIATGGGVTFGGGEPLLYSKAIKQFAMIKDEEISICVETSLNVPRENVEDVIDVVDMFYVDIKTMDSAKYNEYTGGDLSVVIGNLKSLLNMIGPNKITVRIPIIPDYTDKESQKISKKLLQTMGITQFDLFEYIKTN